MQTKAEMPERLRLDGLQTVRAIGAILVALMHAFNLAAAYSENAFFDTLAAAGRSVGLGHFGVDLFFVLSGVVISFAAQRLVEKVPAGLARSGVFYAHRALRIYPLFWATLVAMLLVPPLPGGNNDVQALWAQPWTILLIGSPPALPVAWTLVYEVQFYAVAGALLLFGKHLRKALISWFALTFVLVAMQSQGWLPRFALTDGMTIEFGFGVLLGLFTARFRAPLPLWTAAIGFMAAIVAGALFSDWLPYTTSYRALLFGIPATLVVWAVLTMDMAGVQFPRWGVWFGDISYSIYMWHLPVYALVASVLRQAGALGTAEGALIFLVISMPSAVAISAISFFFFEDWLLGKGKAVLGTRRSADLEERMALLERKVDVLIRMVSALRQPRPEA